MMLFSSPGNPHLFDIQPPWKVHFAAGCSPRISLRNNRDLGALSSVRSFANEQASKECSFSLLLGRACSTHHLWCLLFSSCSRCCHVLKKGSTEMPGVKKASVWKGILVKQDRSPPWKGYSLSEVR